MPTIPEEPHRPTQKQVVIDLLKSIALEESAIAHLLSAEAEKIQALVHSHLQSSSDPGSDPASEFASTDPSGYGRYDDPLYRIGSQSVKLLDILIMKDWLLLRKLESTMAFHEMNDGEQYEEYDE